MPELELTDLPLVDHHCHGVLTQQLDRPWFEALLTESPWPAPPGTSAFDTQLGFAVRRWCAPVLGLPVSAPPDEYVARRASLGVAEVNRLLLSGAGVASWLVDTGYQGGRLLGVAELAQVSGAVARPIVRLEAVAEQVVAAGVTAGEFAARFSAALDAADAVGYKSIVAYRYGLDFDPSRPSLPAVAQAAGAWLRLVESGEPARLTDPVLLRHIIWTAVDRGRPVQFHTGFGDPDVRLHRGDPSLLHDFLMATRSSGAAIMLLHCYPYHRQAGSLANVFPHVYMDVGEALNHVGARSSAVLAEALELTPFAKMLYSSDAFGLPELHYLGAAGFRRDLGLVLSGFVSSGLWTVSDARRVAGMIGAGNARRVYGL
jgi:uncharacterized protein